MKTFRKGGIHPEENKLAACEAIENFPLPKQAVILATQHLGVPSTIVVEKGQRVKVGTLLTKADAFICANVHSSVSGIVSKIDTAIDASGYKKPAIYIDVEGDEWESDIDRSAEIKKEINLSKQEIIDKIKEKGIVGLGGATFPSHVKLMVPADKKAEFLLINAAECEPYLTSDYRILLEKGEEILIGISILKKALDVSIAKVGIENNKADAIVHLSNLAKNYEGIEVHPLKVKYPQGAEKQLIKSLTNREVPTGKLPIEVGCVVNNVGTALAVYEAVQKNKPLVDNILTVSGKSFEVAKNLQVRVGTPFQFIIDTLGGLPKDTEKIISGGPMMGKAVSSLDTPTVKGTSSILIINNKEAKRQESETCIRCGKCSMACPMGLEPFLLAALTDNQAWEKLEERQVMSCMECGSCQYTCPAYRPLLDTVRLGKFKIGNIIRSRTQK